MTTYYSSMLLEAKHLLYYTPEDYDKWRFEVHKEYYSRKLEVIQHCQLNLYLCMRTKIILMIFTLKNRKEEKRVVHCTVWHKCKSKTDGDEIDDKATGFFQPSYAIEQCILLSQVSQWEKNYEKITKLHFQYTHMKIITLYRSFKEAMITI